MIFIFNGECIVVGCVSCHITDLVVIGVSCGAICCLFCMNSSVTILYFLLMLVLCLMINGVCQCV